MDLNDPATAIGDVAANASRSRTSVIMIAMPVEHPRHARWPLIGPLRPAGHRLPGTGALVASIALGSLVVGWSVSVHGQPSDAKAEATAVFQEGMKLFNRGDFAAACDRFEASVALFAGIGNRGKLAECYERVGRTASAWRLYRDVEQQARRMQDEKRAGIAAQRASALEDRLARITVEPGPTVAIAGFTIRSNQDEQPARLFHTAVVVDPGSYRIEATAPGHLPWSSTVVLAEGDSRTVTIPALEPLAREPDGATSARDSRPGPNAGRIAGIALVGLGTASLLGGSTYFGWSARSQWNDVPAACRDGTGICTPDDIALGQEADRRANIANIIGAVGVVSVAAGAFLWWRGSRRQDRSGDASPARSLRLMPTVSPEHVGVLVHARM